MKPAWQVTSTQTFNLGWDQMILLEGDSAQVKVIYRDVTPSTDDEQAGE
jgi:hypothetical protein